MYGLPLDGGCACHAQNQCGHHAFFAYDHMPLYAYVYVLSDAYDDAVCGDHVPYGRCGHFDHHAYVLIGFAHMKVELKVVNRK